MNSNRTRNIAFLLMTGLAFWFQQSAQAQQTPEPPGIHDSRAFQTNRSGTRQRQSSIGPRMIGSSWYSAIDSILSPIDSNSIEYTSSGSRLVKSCTQFRFQGSAWQPFGRFSYYYDSQGGNFRTDYQFWSKNGDSFQNFIRYNYSLNANGAATDLLYQIWDNAKALYLNGYEEQYSLNGRDQQTNILLRYWDKQAKDWGDSSLTINTYSSYGQLQEQVLQYWNSSLSIWEMDKRFTWTFSHNTGHQDADATYEWDKFTNSWMPKEHNLYSLNPSFQATSSVREKYLPVSVSWSPFSQSSYHYNVSDSLTNELIQNWDSANNGYVNFMNWQYLYNKSGQLVEVSALNWGGTGWVVGDNANTSYYYYERTTGVGHTNPISNSIKIFPVPARASVWVTANQEYDLSKPNLQLTDIQGKSINVPLQHISPTELSFSVAEVPSGVYFLRIVQRNGRVEMEKISVLH